MKNFVHIHTHSHYSLLDGIATIDSIISKLDENEQDSAALTDHGSLSGTISFIQKMIAKKKKPIIGIEMYICKDSPTKKDGSNRSLSHMLLYAKNTNGWRSLIRLVSNSNSPDHFYYRPRISHKELEDCSSDLLCCTGHLGSTLGNIALEDYDKATLYVEYLKSIFGSLLYLETQLCDHINTPDMKVLTDIIRNLSKKTKTPIIATNDAHYARQEDSYRQNILLCRQLGNITLEQARKSGKLSTFFKSNKFYLSNYDTMLNEYGHTEEELENTNLFTSQIEEYDILKPPSLPNFTCPEGYNPDSYLKQLCRYGWREKIMTKVDDSQHEIYKDRVLHELEVLQGNNLSSYFLIVGNILKYATDQGWLIGPGRGSAAGCLVSYLTGITRVDPIKYSLIFERFFNAGRGAGAMPDVDCDIPIERRGQIIQYIKDKYGEDKTGQMVTFQKIKARGSIKDTLRCWGGMSFDEINENITTHFPPESKISSELQEMYDQTGSSSIIRYTIENDKRGLLKKYCYIDKDTNEFKGPLAKHFEHACLLEGTNIATSLHPAGIVVSNTELDKVCPMMYNSKSKEVVCGLQMDDLESLGLIKLDILGLAVLDKISYCRDILEGKEED